MSNVLGLHIFSLTYLSFHVSASKEESPLHLPKSLVYAVYTLDIILAIMMCGNKTYFSQLSFQILSIIISQWSQNIT